MFRWIQYLFVGQQLGGQIKVCGSIRYPRKRPNLQSDDKIRSLHLALGKEIYDYIFVNIISDLSLWRLNVGNSSSDGVVKWVLWSTGRRGGRVEQDRGHFVCVKWSCLSRLLLPQAHYNIHFHLSRLIFDCRKYLFYLCSYYVNSYWFYLIFVLSLVLYLSSGS